MSLNDGIVNLKFGKMLIKGWRKNGTTTFDINMHPDK